MTTKYLYKIVERHYDVTAPLEIIMRTVNEAKELHDQGKLTFNEESIYDWMCGIKRDENGCIEGKQSDEETEPEQRETRSKMRSAGLS